MKTANKSSSLSTVFGGAALLAVVLSGCSDRNRDLVEASGVAIDGYLQNAMVCVDVNGNKVCDSNEPRDTTDENAQFALGTFQVAPLLVEITPNVTTESATQGVAGSAVTETFFLTAPLDSTTVTPLTTLVQVGVEQGLYTDFLSGSQAIKTALNVPDAEDIRSYDFLSAGNAQVAVAAEIVSSAIAEAIANIETNVTGDIATTENVFETAIKVLIDPDLAGGVGTSLVEEIGTKVAAEVASDASLEEVDISTTVSTVEAVILADPNIDDASEVDSTTLEQAVEETNAVNETGSATGATGASG